MSIGEFHAIGCAVSWSIAVVLFKKAGDSAPAVVLNLFKNSLGLFLMVPTLWLVEGVWFFPTSLSDLGILALSGILGIGVADGLVLKSLSLVGATRWAVIECLYSPIIIALSLLFLGEQLSGWQCLGALLVLSAVFCVAASSGRPRERQDILRGSLFGVVGLFAMAVGIVIVKPLFGSVALFWVIEMRLLAGVIGSVGTVIVTGNGRRLFSQLRNMERKGTVVLASLFSTYIAMIMWVAGFKYNQASVAAVLNQTATIFTVVLAVVFLREKLTVRKIVGTLLALGGVLMMTVL